ncbi:MAG: hypothetical protein ACREVL_12630 [Solimonas sp.]
MSRVLLDQKRFSCKGDERHEFAAYLETRDGRPDQLVVERSEDGQTWSRMSLRLSFRSALFNRVRPHWPARGFINNLQIADEALVLRFQDPFQWDPPVIKWLDAECEWEARFDFRSGRWSTKRGRYLE